MRLRKLLLGAIVLGLVAAGLAQEATIAPNDALILENIPRDSCQHRRARRPLHPVSHGVDVELASPDVAKS